MTHLLNGEGNQKINSAAVGTNAGCTATLAAPSDGNARNIVTHISGSGDAAAVVTLEAPTGTVKWRKRFAAAFTFSETFRYGEYENLGTVSVKISASTSNSEVNIAGVLAGG